MNKQITRINVPNILVDGWMWSDMLTDLTREKFPHTDMIKLDEEKFEIHMSLAGYEKKNINVELANNILEVSGKWDVAPENKTNDASADFVYVMHGISKRNFKRMFPLSEYVEVRSVNMDNGLLKIKIEKVVPEELKPKVFKVT